MAPDRMSPSALSAAIAQTMRSLSFALAANAFCSFAVAPMRGLSITMEPAEPFELDLIGLEVARAARRIDHRAHVARQGIDEARLAGPRLTGDEDAQRLGASRRLPAVAQRRSADVPGELRLRNSQPAAVKIDRRTADLAHVGAGQLARHLIAYVGIKMLGDLLARFLRGGRHRVDQTDEAPDVVSLLRHADGRTPAVDLQTPGRR